MRASICTTEMQGVRAIILYPVVHRCSVAYIGSTELIVCSRLGGTPTKECCIQLDWGELCIAGHICVHFERFQYDECSIALVPRGA